MPLTTPTSTRRLESGFKVFEEGEGHGSSLESWAEYLQHVVQTCLGPFTPATTLALSPSLSQAQAETRFAARASELLLRWSFMSSLVIRDLTLRSATSFGMFHLMRLLCDGSCDVCACVRVMCVPVCLTPLPLFLFTTCRVCLLPRGEGCCERVMSKHPSHPGGRGGGTGEE